jgi:hypothetical protein
MKSIDLNEEQLQKMKAHPAGSKWWQHAKGAGPLWNQRRRMVERGRDVRHRAPNAHPHD